MRLPVLSIIACDIFEYLGCQLYFLKEDSGEIVEDCISAALGGDNAYAGTVANNEEGYVFPYSDVGFRTVEIPKEMISGHYLFISSKL